MYELHGAVTDDPVIGKAVGEQKRHSEHAAGADRVVSEHDDGPVPDRREVLEAIEHEADVQSLCDRRQLIRALAGLDLGQNIVDFREAEHASRLRHP